MHVPMTASETQMIRNELAEPMRNSAPEQMASANAMISTRRPVMSTRGAPMKLAVNPLSCMIKPKAPTWT